MEFRADDRMQVWCDALYAQYLGRQETDAAALVRQAQTVLPEALNYRGMPGLSNELVLKLERQQPRTLDDAERIEGMTPAALLLILAHARKLTSAQRAKA